MEYDNLFDLKKYPRFSGSNLKPDFDGPCLCLSGKKYCDCCKTKIEQSRLGKASRSGDVELERIYNVKKSKLPSHRMIKSIIKKKKLGYCMAADVLGNCSCINNSADADVRYSHTMSQGFILKNLCGQGKYMVTAIDDEIMINNLAIPMDERFLEMNIKEASVTTSFCRYHDDYLFAEIEKEDKQSFVGSDIQNLEYALKAVTFELFDSIEAIYYLARLLEETPEVVYENEKESIFLVDYRVKLGRLKDMKELADRLILEIENCKSKGAKSKLNTIVVNLIEYSKVEYSLSEIFENGYFINVVNAPDPTIIFSYYPDNENGDDAVKDLVDELSKKNDKQLLYDFTEYAISNAKNIYFNPDVINNMSRHEKEQLYIAHREGFKLVDNSESLISKLYTS